MAEQTWIDRHKCSRDRPMRCLVLGPGRSGTDSIRAAMKILGLDDCYHGYSVVFENPPDSHFWREAMDAKFEGKGKPFQREDWDKLLGHCQSVADLPCVLFSEDLIAAYPEAKVILSHPPKGFDAWYESCCRTIVQRKDSWSASVRALLNREAYITRDTFFRSFDYFWRNDFKANAKSVLADHNAMIRRLVPAENLLEYSVTEGWEPLCKFLDLPIPDTPFPAGNDPLDFFKRFAVVDRRRERETFRNLTIFTGVAVTACYGLYYYLRK